MAFRPGPIPISMKCCQHLVRCFPWGDLGVWVFFVISGFVIPFSMRGESYCFPRDAGPVSFSAHYSPSTGLYCLSIFGGWYRLLGRDDAGYRGAPYICRPTNRSLVQVVYLPPWFGKDWINAVAWTLAFEFQYYILMLFIAPLLLSRVRSRRWMFLVVIAILSFVSSDTRAVFMYLPCFALGFVTFLHFEKLLSIKSFAATVIGFGALTWLNLGPLPTIAAFATVASYFPPDYEASANFVLCRHNLIFPILGSCLTDWFPRYQPDDPVA